MTPLWGVALLQAICTCLLLAGIAWNDHRVMRMRRDLAEHRMNLERSLAHLEAEISRTRQGLIDEHALQVSTETEVRDRAVLAENRHSVAEERYALGEARNRRQHPADRKDNGMAKQVIEVPVWDARVDGPDEERNVAAGDWRDADIIQDLDGLTMYSNDLDYQESHSKSAPDWTLGCEARDANNRAVLVFGGEPCSPFKEALIEGRVLYGVAVARDEQRHGVG